VNLAVFPSIFHLFHHPLFFVLGSIHPFSPAVFLNVGIPSIPVSLARQIQVFVVVVPDVLLSAFLALAQKPIAHLRVTIKLFAQLLLTTLEASLFHG
jgi:hypothetical protein